MKTIDYEKRVKWNKNTLLDSSSYFVAYMNSLKEHLSTSDRQEFYMIAKFFTDGVEYARDNINLSRYYFKIGELYKKQIPPTNKMLKKIVCNSYDRAKSYFYFKVGNYLAAENRIQNTLKINNQLKDTIPILIFDSISQYLNLIKLYTTQKNESKANFILTELIGFLFLGTSSLDSFKNCSNIVLDKKFDSFRFFFINDIVFNYIFINDVFLPTQKNLLKQKYYLQNELIKNFIDLYLEYDDKKLILFKSKYKDVYKNIPIKILEQKFQHYG